MSEQSQVRIHNMTTLNDRHETITIEISLDDASHVMPTVKAIDFRNKKVYDMSILTFKNGDAVPVIGKPEDVKQELERQGVSIVIKVSDNNENNGIVNMQDFTSTA